MLRAVRLVHECALWTKLEGGRDVQRNYRKAIALMLALGLVAAVGRAVVRPSRPPVRTTGGTATNEPVKGGTLSLLHR